MSENAPKKDLPRYPSCESTHILKNGSAHHKKPNFLCKTCGRQFIETPPKSSISSGLKKIIKKTFVRKKFFNRYRPFFGCINKLQNLVNSFYRSIPCQMRVLPETPTDIEWECDEIWSFVNSQKNPVYLWLAIERKTRRLVGVYFGDRSRESTEQFWRYAKHDALRAYRYL